MSPWWRGARLLSCALLVASAGCSHAARGGGSAPGAFTPATLGGADVSALLALGNHRLLVGTGNLTGDLGFGGGGGHIYYSDDDGGTFQAATIDMGSSPVDPLTSVVSLVFSPASGAVYAALGSLSGSPADGVYVSTDQGATFSPDSTGLPAGAMRLRHLAVDASSTERLYALVEGNASCALCAVGALYVQDAGNDWIAAAMTGVDPSSGGPALALAADPSQAGRVFLASDGDFFVSTDSGDSFSATAFGDAAFGSVGTADVDGVYVDAADPQHIYVTTRDAGVGVIDSADGGASWQRFYVPAGAGVTDLAVSGSSVWVATRGGGLFTVDSSAPAGRAVGAATLPPVVTRIAVAPDAAGTLYAGSLAKGVYHSADSGKTFSLQTSGLDELLGLVRVTGSASPPDVWVLSAAGLFRSRDAGSSWSRLVLPLGTDCLADVAEDPADPQHLLVATDEEVFRDCGRGLGVLDVHLDTGSVTAATGLTGRNVRSVRFDPHQAARVYAYQHRSIYEPTGASGPDTGVFVSADAGATFTPTSMVVDAGHQGALLMSPLAVAPDGTVFAGILPDPPGPGVYASLWRSSDGGASYDEVYSASDHWVPQGVWVRTAGTVYMAGAYSDGVRQSLDNGDTFNEHDDGLKGSGKLVVDLAVGADGSLLAATRAGLEYAADGATFTDVSTVLPAGVEPLSVVLLPTSPATAVVATDHGVVTVTLPQP